MKNTCLLLLLVSLVFGSFQSGQVKGSTANFHVIELSDGVYACINTFGGKSICNSGIVDNGESTIIFDTFLSPEAAEEMIQFVERLKLSPIRYVINSHFHNDHIRGNQSFSPEVKILSTKRTAELIEREEPTSIAAEKVYGRVRYNYFDSLSAAYEGDTTAREYQIIKMMRTYFEVLSESHEKIRTRLPDTYVVKDKSLDGSKRRVRLIEKGKGHTESDMIMFLPDDAIVFAGDLVFNKCHPYMGDGYPAEWKRILTEMELMQIKVVIPGHGDAGGIETIKAMREYIESIEAIAEKLRSEGVGKEEIKKVQIPERYRDWWLENYFWANVEDTYNRTK